MRFAFIGAGAVGGFYGALLARQVVALDIHDPALCLRLFKANRDVGILIALALLAVVLIPGIGHEVNGSRRWIRIGLLNFQPSEVARWLLLTYIAVFAVRHQTELRSSAQGFFKPLDVNLIFKYGLTPVIHNADQVELLHLLPDLGRRDRWPHHDAGIAHGRCAQGDALRAQLRDNAVFFRERLTALGFRLVPGNHPIIPVMLGDATLATGMADRLLQHGVYVVGFSFPVVPKGQARIRVQMSAAHTRGQLEQAVLAFARVGRELRIIKMG